VQILATINWDCLGPQLFGICLRLDFIPQLLFSRIKSEFDVMKVFTTFICAAKNEMGAQLLFFHGENKSWAPNLFSPRKSKL